MYYVPAKSEREMNSTVFDRIRLYTTVFDGIRRYADNCYRIRSTILK
jgi:hypothetical protein